MIKVTRPDRDGPLILSCAPSLPSIHLHKVKPDTTVQSHVPFSVSRLHIDALTDAKDDLGGIWRIRRRGMARKRAQNADLEIWGVLNPDSLCGNSCDLVTWPKERSHTPGYNVSLRTAMP